MSRVTRETSTLMRRAIPRHLAAVTVVVVTVLVALIVDVAARPVAAPAASAPAQAVTTVAPAAPPATAEAPAEAPASTPVTDDATTSTVGDSAADRRIRRIVLILCGLAVVVLITTVMFWRATQPVPRSLERLRGFGVRSERRRAASAAQDPPSSDAPSPEPTSIVGDQGAPVLSDPLVASQTLGLVEAPPSRPGASLPADG